MFPCQKEQVAQAALAAAMLRFAPTAVLSLLWTGLQQTAAVAAAMQMSQAAAMAAAALMARAKAPMMSLLLTALQ